MDYITAREAAEKWNISERLVQKYCSQGRIDGTKKFGASWGIPADADKPSDPRKKNSKKIGRTVTVPDYSRLPCTTEKNCTKPDSKAKE